MVQLADRTRIEDEMQQAQAARGQGKEGRARVGARRAAGMALAAHWSAGSRANAYELLQRAAADAQLPETVRRAASRLTVRVTASYQLPHDEDPLLDARLILTWLGHAPVQDDPPAAGHRQEEPGV